MIIALQPVTLRDREEKATVLKFQMCCEIRLRFGHCKEFNKIRAVFNYLSSYIRLYGPFFSFSLFLSLFRERE